MKKALGYIRVSSMEQGKSGFGLDIQEAQVRKFATLQGYRLIGVRSEVASARGGESITNRPILQSVLNESKADRIPVLVCSMDRLSRDEAEIGRIVKSVWASGTEVIFLDEEGASKFVHLQVKAASVQRRSELLSSRTKAGIERARASGQVFGNQTNLPDAQRLGASANRSKARKWVLEEVMPQIRDTQATGVKTAKAIAAALNNRGFLTASNAAWSEANVRRVLKQAEEYSRPEAPAFYKDDPLWGVF